MQLENAMFITSIDVDVGNKELGIINRGQNDSNVSSRFSEYFIGEIEELALPLFVDLFNHFEIPVTFAIRGQLTEVCDPNLKCLLKSPMRHDIGAHGYYHREFRKLSLSEADRELRMIAVGMEKLGHVPESFVFPRNSIAHLDLLVKYGYKCYRGFDFCLQIEQKEELYDVHPSLFVDQNTSSRLLTRMLDVCTTKKLPFHVWFHLWNFGKTNEAIQKNINKLFFPIFEYAQTKVESGVLTFETMASAAKKV
jgi:peptidoglycan/xylan/chitin deacetylase (PgdA/CDA1 family)